MWFFMAIRNLFRNCRRTIAILLTVALGTGALFAFDGFITGVLDELKHNTIHANYGHGQINTKGYRDTIYEDPTKYWISDSNRVIEEVTNIEGVEQAFPRVSFSALLSHGKHTIGGSGQGVKAEKEAEFFHSMNIEEGETLSTQKKGILLGKGLAKALHAKPGDKITVNATSTKSIINSGEFVVTGIFHTGTLEFDNRMFRIQLPAAQTLLKTSKIELISLGLHDKANWASIEAKIANTFNNLETTPFHVLDEVYYQHSVDWLKAQYQVVQIIILTIVLLGIFNTISASILERKQEIGNLRANGESIFSVMKLIVTEGGLLGVIGSIIGMLGSFSLLMIFVNKGLLMPPGPGQTRQFLVSFAFKWNMVIFTLLISTIAAIIASFFAGIKVTRMTISKSLRSH